MARLKEIILPKELIRRSAPALVYSVKVHIGFGENGHSDKWVNLASGDRMWLSYTGFGLGQAELHYLRIRDRLAVAAGSITNKNGETAVRHVSLNGEDGDRSSKDSKRAVRAAEQEMKMVFSASADQISDAPHFA